MRLIHISDPHLTSLWGISPKQIVGKRRLGYASWRWRRRHRHLRTCLDELCAAAASLDPDVIVVTGDLVHLGLPSEIEAAADWLRALGPPQSVFLVPGNHDLYREDSWAAVEAHWGAYLRLASNRSEEPPHWAGFPTCLYLDGIEVHGLNTGLPTSLLEATGELGQGQCARLAERLDGADEGSLRILGLHHPPAAGEMQPRKALKDCQRLAPVAEKVHFALHGHGHYNKSYRAGKLRVYATGSASTADAAFRCFDIARQDGGWRVEMRLQSRSPAGFVTTEAETFTLP